jgi:hypothetical protein
LIFLNETKNCTIFISSPSLYMPIRVMESWPDMDRKKKMYACNTAPVPFFSGKLTLLLKQRRRDNVDSVMEHAKPNSAKK